MINPQENILQECKNALKLENTLIKRGNFIITFIDVQKVFNKTQFLFQIKVSKIALKESALDFEKVYLSKSKIKIPYFAKTVQTFSLKSGREIYYHNHYSIFFWRSQLEDLDFKNEMQYEHWKKDHIVFIC